jgi:hypothetical protein
VAKELDAMDCNFGLMRRRAKQSVHIESGIAATIALTKIDWNEGNGGWRHN